MTSSYRGLLWVTATAVISGVSIFINAWGVKGIEPALFAALKNSGVGLLLVGSMLAGREWPRVRALGRSQKLRLLLIGLIGGSVPFILFFNGLVLTTAAKSGFIHKSMFIFVAILAMLWLKEKITAKIWIGISALLAGQIIFLNVKPQALNTGDLLILAATIFWAVEIVLSKRALADIPVRIVAAGRMFFGGLFIWLFLLLMNQWQTAANLTPAHWGWVAVTTVFLFGYVYSFYHGLQLLPAHLATAMLAIGAPITVLLSAIFLDGNLSWTQGLGTVIMIGSAVGLGFAVRSNRQLNLPYVFRRHHR